MIKNVYYKGKYVDAVLKKIGYLQEGDEVILGISNHHANIVP